MTKLEDQLRLAFRAKASEITPPPPPLELQPRPVHDPAARRGSGGLGTPLQRKWLIPLAAAVAVLAVVAGALAVGGALPVSRTPPAAPIQTSVPPYYVALVNTASPAQPRTVATVRETTTGAAIARITPPRPYISFDAVSGAADDRTFVLEALGKMIRGNGVVPERFYRLHINPSATSAAGRAQLTALPAIDISGGNELQAMALSPDGSSLAAILTHGIWDYLYVYNLPTGPTRIWIRKLCRYCRQTELGMGPGAGPTAAVTLSWTADGKSLAFVPGAGTSQLRLLDLGAPGENVQPNSKPLAIPRTPTAQWSQAYMTPDAKTVFLSCMSAWGGTPANFSQWVSLLRFSARTGKLTTINKLTLVNRNRNAGYKIWAPVSPDDVLWTSYDGSQAIIANIRPGAQNAGIYSGSHYTPIPWPANVIDAAW